MPQLLTLLRAARMVGVSRGALQSRIRSGELQTFEGMVRAEDLQRAYPDARLEHNAGLERLEQIKDSAYAKRMRERLLPSTDALIARITTLGKDRAQLLTERDFYRAVTEQLLQRLKEIGSLPAHTALAGLQAWLQQSLEAGPHGEEPEPLLVQDSFLRVMAAHVQVQPANRDFFVDGNDNLLEAALRAGLSLDYGCSSGSCGKCKAKVLSGQVHRTRHSDFALTAAEKNAGVVLLCCHTALTDMVIEADTARHAADIPQQSIDAKVKSISPLGTDVRLLHLQTPRSNRLRFLAGQSVTLTLPGGERATLPVASCPCDDRNLQFHVCRRDDDDFAVQVFSRLKSTDTVHVEGPQGEFVLNEESHRPLVFIAWNDGFAPVKSVIEHAMALDASDTLHLYWITEGAPNHAGGHYLNNLCRSWSDALDNFRYLPITAAAGATTGSVLQPVLQDHPSLQECDVYIAGPAAHVQAAGKLLLEHGLPPTQLVFGILQKL